MCGALDEHLALIEQFYDINLTRRGHIFWLTGMPEHIVAAQNCLNQLSQVVTSAHVDRVDLKSLIFEPDLKNQSIQAHRNSVRCYPKHPSQKKYQLMIQSHCITFGIGPAGTGKTFLAIAEAVAALQQHTVDRIVLTRPAVEAGEHLGFLPGDLQQKIDPYLRPLFDALNQLLGPETVQSLLVKNIIEVAPLAFMRGRTLSHAFVILDEAQNTTSTQMKLFLTRLGEGSKMVITGDCSQIDLPSNQLSGLQEAIKLLKDIPEIGFYFFQKNDIVRHPLIGQIIEAYGDT